VVPRFFLSRIPATAAGLAREIDPRAEEMSFRQVPTYTLLVDMLKPVTDDQESLTDLDLDKTTFLAAVDRNTKAPKFESPVIDGFRGALSYAVARAFEGSADDNHDGKVTLKELFANVRQWFTNCPISVRIS